MLEHLQLLPPDPILGLAAAAKADTNPHKVDLTVGIYQDEQGVCPVFDAVRVAQQRLDAAETTKAYIAAAGDADFLSGMGRLVLGDAHPALSDSRVSVVQAPGGCGALRIGAEIIQAARPGATVWISDPTWPVHIPLIGSVGLQFKQYRYYQGSDHSVDFEGMVQDLSAAGPDDVVLLHGCCHNPCGADLNAEQWETVAAMAEKQGFLPFVDIAYQGMGDGLDADAAGLRLLAQRLPEVIIAASCSKNMGLYRERTGAAVFVCRDATSAAALRSQALVAARRIYSMPPAHGAILAGMVLSDTELQASWRAELDAMCQRINGLRGQLVEALGSATGRDFGFIAREKGMFSFLGLSLEQTLALREQHSVYMLDSSRINVAGVNSGNMERLVTAVAGVL